MDDLEPAGMAGQQLEQLPVKMIEGLSRLA